MVKDREKIESAFRLLKSVLQEAFRVQTVLLSYPYEDLNKTDFGLRAMVWENYNDENAQISFEEHEAPYRLLVVRSNLGFYNILLFFDKEAHPDFISVGPFRDEEISADYFTQILKESNLAPSELAGMKRIYEKMSFVQVETVLRVTQQIVGNFFVGFDEVGVEYVQYSDQERMVAINVELIQDYSAESAERYRELILAFMERLKCGELSEAREALKIFLDETDALKARSIYEYKRFLNLLNDYCHIALLQTDIHPSYVLNVAMSFRNKLEGITSRAKLEKLPHEICRKYCLLVKNYANTEYSRMVREVISYIRLHLEEELSLRILAEHFDRNASVLSNIFKKEVGQSLTAFIQQTRMEEAVRLFNTTDKSVSEVALLVGYQDFSYFSKLFSRHMGCSPRDYRQNV